MAEKFICWLDHRLNSEFTEMECESYHETTNSHILNMIRVLNLASKQITGNMGEWLHWPGTFVASCMTCSKCWHPFFNIC
jgi:hypothetical protein